ncbi:MAG: DUF2294 domain-containing protein [Kiritimatiellae bacterium]|nr:DUF2294 domain-containing protein [Kiritimatiellia bacterium]MDW8457683.1 DUF2294 domain-containing protein [Verrucomicrobiota bacterium]
MPESRGELEARITEAFVKFEREYMGRGPAAARTYLIDDMVLVRLQGVITRAEHHLAAADPTGRGRDLIKQTRLELLEKARPEIEKLIADILGRRIKSLHTDISVKSGERIILLTLESPPNL